MMPGIEVHYWASVVDMRVHITRASILLGWCVPFAIFRDPMVIQRNWIITHISQRDIITWDLRLDLAYDNLLFSCVLSENIRCGVHIVLEAWPYARGKRKRRPTGSWPLTRRWPRQQWCSIMLHNKLQPKPSFVNFRIWCTGKISHNPWWLIT